MRSDLFGRKYRVRVTSTEGGIGTELDVSELRCSFKITKTIKPEPNSCELQIWNLSRDSAAKLSSANRLTANVAAGYESTGVHTLFVGGVGSAHTSVDGPDVVTEISAHDGAEAKGKNARTAAPKNTTAAMLLQTLANAMKLKVGNLPAALAAKHFPVTTAFSGNASDLLTDICISFDLEWSIQNGTLLLLPRGKASEVDAVVLSPETGLIGSPSVDGKGIVKAQALIMPGLEPGRLVRIDSRYVRGDFRVEKVDFTGDTHDTDWYAEIEAKTPKT